MFCGKCGAKNLDDATFCRECGAPLQGGGGGRAVTTPRVVPAQNSQRNRKIGIIAVVAVVAVVAIVLIALLGGRSYRATVDQFVEATFSGDVEAMVELIPEELWKYGAMSEGVDREELINELGDMLRDSLDTFDQQLGSDWSASHEILSVEELEGEDLRDVQEDYRTIGVDVSAGKTVEVEITLQGNGTETSYTMDVPLIQCGRSWYIAGEEVF